MPYFETRPKNVPRDNISSEDHEDKGLSDSVFPELPPSTPQNRTEPDISVHIPRTPDESYYRGLSHEQLSRRNRDQVLSRVTEEEGHESLLMVSQLWLWKIDHVILTAFPNSRNEEGPKSLLYDGIASLLEDLSEPVAVSLTHEQLTAWILSECINFIDRPHMAGLQEPVLIFFEKAVAKAADDVQKYTDRDDFNKREVTIELFEKAVAKAADDAPKNTDRADFNKMEITIEKKMIHDIGDIREELAMISNILSQQQEIWDAFSKDKRIWSKDSNLPTDSRTTKRAAP
ncbi:hypothetical protein NA57DRAFT_71761 [Rhizodiscina lignyota]|uniref:Uncharacterized protein n=1 Tax=Rhizodiscina lignyota TaxID=1504668 RepID=A0A9P4M9J4_9PEZI|nr:hypothetical protein NA57DRAFT_71761 [Rhizodiscina lignyota]